MHEYISRSFHSIFNHRKDIVYRRSSSILISVIRISYRKITLYECPFNIQRRLGLGVAYVTILVRASGSSLGKLFYLRFFFILNKNQTRRAQENDMIFMYVTSRHFWTETMASDNNRPLNSKIKQIVYSVSSCFLKITKKPFGLRTWKAQLKPQVLLELPLLSRNRREKSARRRLSSPTGRESHIITLSPSTRQQSDITRFYSVRKHLPTLNTLNSALVWDLSFPGVWRECGDRGSALV